MINFSYGFWRPFKNIRDLIINSILFAILFAIPIYGLIAGVIAVGYILGHTKEVVKTKGAKDIKIKWKIGSFLLLVFKAFVMGLVYMLPFFALFGIFAWKEMPPGFSAAILAIVSIFFSGLMFLTGLMIFFDEDRFSSGFAFKKIFKIIGNGHYLLNWLLGFVYMFGLSFVIKSARVMWPGISYQFAAGFVQYIATLTFLSIIAITYTKIRARIK